MTLERAVGGLRQTGDPVDAERANIIERILKSRGKDIQLPAIEALPNIQRFTPEARKALEKKGYLIYVLSGQSIRTLRNAGKPFWSTWHKDYPELEVMKSSITEVAIDPSHLFIPGSNNKTLKEQEDIVKQFSKGLKVKGAEAIIGEMPDYVDLAFAHLDATGDRLFGQKHGFNFTRTITPTSKSDVAHVGNFDAARGLSVGHWDRGLRDGNLFVAPLVVPKA